MDRYTHNPGRLGLQSKHSQQFYGELGRRLHSCRRLNRLTLKQLAALTNVTYQQLMKYENGSNRPPILILLRLAEIFDVALDDLLPQPMSAEEQGDVAAIISLFGAIKDPEKREAAVELMRIMAGQKA